MINRKQIFTSVHNNGLCKLDLTKNKLDLTITNYGIENHLAG